MKIECLPKMLRHLITLLSDVSVVVQKRVIQAANVIYKNALIWICSTANCTDEIEQTWIMLNELKVRHFLLLM